jgi:hypothetical protein
MKALISILLLACTLDARCVELVMRAQDKKAYLTEKTEATRGQSVSGMIIDIGPDGKDWGKKVCPPEYTIIKLPGVKDSPEIRKYLIPEYNGEAHPTNRVRYRAWKYVVTNLSTLSARTFTNAAVTIKDSGGDTTWDLFKTNLFNIKTWTAETNNAGKAEATVEK